MKINLLKSSSISPLRTYVLIFLVCEFLVACTLVPAKNQTFYDTVVSASEILDELLIKSKTTPGKIDYSTNKEDYNKIEGEMNKMVMLARLDNANDSTISIAENIRQDFRDMVALHVKEKKLTPAFFGSKQMGYEALFFSLLKSEDAKPEK